MICVNYILLIPLICIINITSKTPHKNTTEEKYVYLEICNIEVAYQGYLDFSIPSQKHYFHYNMETPFSYITKYTKTQGYFHSSPVDFSFKFKYTLFNNQEYIAHKINASIYFSEMTPIPKLQHFDLLFFPTTSIADTLSLAHSYIGSEYNLIEQLYKEKLITKRKFSFYINSAFNGQLFIGQIPSTILSDFHYKSQCAVVNQNKPNIWSCNLNSIKIEGGLHDMNVDYFINKQNMISYFQTTERSIKVPEYFFDYLNGTIFNEYLIRNICTSNRIGQKSFFKCDCEEMYPFPTFYFEFEGGMTLVLDRDMMFQDYVTVCYFQIEKWGDLSENEWVFGVPVFRKFIPEFNFDEDVITFYAKEGSYLNMTKRDLNKGEININKIIVVFNIILLSLCCIFIFVIKYTK